MNEKYTQYLMNKYGVSWFKFDEESGNILDSKGSAVGTPTNITRVIDGTYGRVLSFNGTSSYVQFNTKVIPIGPKSIRFKIKANVNDTHRIIMDTCDHNPAQNGFQIMLTAAGAIFFRMFNGSSSWSYTASSNYEIVKAHDGNWHDVLITYKDKVVEIYVDEVLHTTTTLQITEPSSYTNNFRLGRSVSTDTSVKYFSGLMSDVEIYNEVITPNPTSFNLIKSNNKIYTFDTTLIETPLIEPLTKEDFINNGILDLGIIPKNELDSLGPIYEILNYNENGSIPKVSLNIDPFKPFKILDNPDLIFYWDLDNIPKLHQEIKTITQIRYLVSKDSIDYYSYINNEWVIVDKSDIIKLGMSKLDIENIEQEAWGMLFDNEAYKNEFKLLIGIYGENPNQVLINDITVEFAENKSPYIINPKISPDNIHNEYATITGILKDYEGDSIKYRVLIKKNNEKEFYVADDWVTVSNGFEFTRAYNKPYFNTGKNIIRVEAMDQRGAVSYWETNLVMTNNNPLINYSYNPFGFIGTISDKDTDKVAIQVSLNGDIVVPFGEPMQTPKLFKYEWDNNLVKKNVINVVKIELLDEYGGYSSEEFTFIGEYKNILFMDEDGYYYSTDTGIPIKVLDKGMIESGEDSEPIKIIVKNNTNYTISNLKLELIPENIIPNNIKIYMSETNNPLTNKDTIEFISPMSHGEEKDIYLYIKTEKGTTMPLNKVDILASAKIVLE